MSMTKLEEFLWENDMYCDTCAHYTKNTPKGNVSADVCGLACNKQTTLYEPQYLRLPPQGVCHHWKQYFTAMERT